MSNPNSLNRHWLAARALNAIWTLVTATRLGRELYCTSCQFLLRRLVIPNILMSSHTVP